MRTLRTISVGVLAACLAFTSTGASNASPLINKSNHAADAPLELNASPSVIPANAMDVNAQALVANVTTDVQSKISLDAKAGVAITNGEKSLTATLPNGESAGKGVATGSGTVTYAGTNGANNVAEFTAEGLRMLTVIERADAPTEYEYKLDVPEGATLHATTDGGVVVFQASTRETVAFIAPPWAKDANQTDLPTHYKIDGNKLTQVVEHHGAAYPVTADPSVSWQWWGVTIYFNKWESQVVAWSPGAAAAYWGWTGIPGLAMFAAAGLANWAVNNGYCIAISRHRWQPIYHMYWFAWYYRC
jgi:hypothetical protein